MPERVIGVPARSREHRRAGFGADLGEPGPQLSGSGFPERHDALLAALSVQVHGGLPVQEHVRHAQRGELGDAGAGVVGGGQQHRVTTPAPGAAVGCGQDRGDLLAGQVSQHGPVEPFGWYRQHPCGDRQRCGVAAGGVAHERVDRRQARVAGPGSVAPPGLQVVKEIQDERGVEVGQAERGGRLAGALPRANPSSSSKASR